MANKKTKNKKEKLQWHPAFCSATELELREDKENLEFIREYSLSQKPLQIDLMVIKKKPGIKIKNEIGHIFKTHNIIEYKSPDDSLNIDDYYKSLGYVCLYKAFGKRVNEIPLYELSLTLVHDSKPEKLIKILEKNNHRIVNKYNGIYYIEGSVTLPNQQIIVTSEIGKGHFLLKSLSKNFTVEDGINLANFSETVKSKEDNLNLDSVFQVSVMANDRVFNELRKENNSMYEVLMDLFKDEIAAKISAAEAAVRAEEEKKAKAKAKVYKEKILALEAEIAKLKKNI